MYKQLMDAAVGIILKNSKIIGMTTSCSARMNRTLKDIGIRIVLVEEAAHVFESHVISALTPTVEHLVLIGDHNQMRAFSMNN